ncbi:MAG: hydrolase [Spirochaetes bacterium]|nr:MAG: hydrolase [Spirochaetota bacterium]
MREILCYGDSNTWGWDPEKKARYPREIRWTGVLQSELGEDYHVIEEGQNGRTTVWDDPIEGYKNGLEYLYPCLETHKPLDLVIIMLGTNDLKYRFSVSSYDIAKGMGRLIDVVQKSDTGKNNKSPELLVIAPPPLGKLTEFAEMFQFGTEKSKTLAIHYSNICKEKGCHFLDAGTVIKSSDIDGIHLEAEEHKKLGRAVAKAVKRIIG